jgi:hypothetical protein
MQYNELIQLYFERSNALQSYWTLYVVIIGGLLAFASLRLRPDLLTTVLVAVLFACFAYKNLGAIHDVTIQRHAVLEAIKKTASPSPVAAVLDPTLQPPEFAGVRNFHVFSDLLTIITLGAIELRRRKYALVDRRAAAGIALE